MLVGLCSGDSLEMVDHLLVTLGRDCTVTLIYIMVLKCISLCAMWQVPVL